MIRTVGDVTRAFDGRFGGVGRDPASLIRIVGWLLVGLVLIGYLWPAPHLSARQGVYNKKITNVHVRDVSLDPNDPRGFSLRRHRNSFTIAWIGASTLQSIKPGRYTFIPSDVQQLIPRIQGRDVYVDMYFLSGARSVDVYAATQAAIAAKPDLIVLSLNPVWMFNDRAIQSWPNLDGIVATRGISDPGAWPLLASLVSPSDLALGEASRRLPAIRDRWSYAVEVRKQVGRLSPLDTSTPPPRSKPSELGRIAAMGRPLEFWSKYRPTSKAGVSLADRQLAFLAGGDPGTPSVNQLVTDRTLAALAASGIPTYVYVDAINQTALRDPRVDAQLKRIEDGLKTIVDKHVSPNITVRWQSAARTLPPMEFNDLAHIADDRPIAYYLARELCDRLKASDIPCTPKKVKLK